MKEMKEKQTTEAIEDQFLIPASEWDKVDAYIKKGSDFKKVGTMCKGNKTKYTSRSQIKTSLEKQAQASQHTISSSLTKLKHGEVACSKQKIERKQ